MKTYTVRDTFKHTVTEVQASSQPAAARKYTRETYSKDVKVRTDFYGTYSLIFPMVRWLEPAPRINLYVHVKNA